MVKPHAWRFALLCGVGMVLLQTGLALYRFGGTTGLGEWVNPQMWIGQGLFFVTGGLIGLVIERLLRGPTGRFRALLVVATILATPLAIGLSLVEDCSAPPPGVLIYGLLPYLLLVGIPRLIGKGWAVWTRRGTGLRRAALGMTGCPSLLVRSVRKKSNALDGMTSFSDGSTQSRRCNQIKRVWGCTVSLIYADKRDEARVSSLVAHSIVFWWDPKQPDQAGLWENKIAIGEKFFQKIIRYPYRSTGVAPFCWTHNPLGEGNPQWGRHTTRIRRSFDGRGSNGSGRGAHLKRWVGSSRPPHRQSETGSSQAELDSGQRSDGLTTAEQDALRRLRRENRR